MNPEQISQRPLPLPPRRRSRPLSFGAWLFIVSASVLTSLVLLLVVSNVLDGIRIPIPWKTNEAITLNSPGSPGERIILVMGVDLNYSGKDRYTFEGTRTDSMMLVRISPNKKTISVVSIPRDSKVYYAENRGIGKINGAHAIGGPDMAVQTVQESFGITVDNFLVVNTRGVRELVDAVGGIDVYVEKPMRYRDNTAKLNINFDKGYYKMTGEQAEGFLRFRHDALGDIGRIRRQQNFMSALAGKFKKDPWLFTKLPNLMQVASKHIQTDLSGDDIAKLAWFARGLEPKDIRVATLPGHPSGSNVSYWVIDPIPAQEILDRLILDNPAYAQLVPSEKTPLQVGIFYNKDLEERLPQIEQAIAEAGFEVVCKSKRSNAGTQIIEHSNRVTDDFSNRLRSTTTTLKNARLIFAPVGTTYETNTCSSGEDYTVIIGEDALTGPDKQIAAEREPT